MIREAFARHNIDRIKFRPFNMSETRTSEVPAIEMHAVKRIAGEDCCVRYFIATGIMLYGTQDNWDVTADSVAMDLSNFAKNKGG